MLAKYRIDLEKTTLTQYLTVGLLVLVYLGIFTIPLIDNDAAHHANIALHMYRSGDYHSLVDRGNPYLDKPHLLFWVAAFSYKLFGVTTFAYRLPALLFGLLSVVSIYKLVRHLSDVTTAKLSALMLATTIGFLFSMIDARMEAPLTAGIALGLWQMTVYIDKRKFINILLAALGAGIAFDTKGWIGVAVIFITCFLKILLEKKWSVLADVKTYLFLPLFALFISPVLYSYYLQYDLHPDIVVRGMSHISGVAFILWNQNFERFGGNNFAKGGRNSDYFFLYHTFLWEFAPWCLFAYMSVWYWLRRLFYKKKTHPFTPFALSFAIILFTISFSKFKMPHYILMLFPLAAVITAPYVRLVLSSKLIKFFFPLHLVLGYLTIAAVVLLNFYFFKPVNDLIAIAGVGLLITLFILITFKDPKRAMKVVYVSAFLSIALNFFMTYNFFPNLMRYQGGNELAGMIKKSGTSYPPSDITLIDSDSHSFDFTIGYTHCIVKIDSLIQHYGPVMQQQHFLLNSSMKRKLEDSGFVVQPDFLHLNYQVSKVKGKFLNADTREAQCDSLMLATIHRR